MKIDKETYRLLNDGKNTTACEFAWCGKESEPYKHFCAEHRSDCKFCDNECDYQLNGYEVCYDCAWKVKYVTLEEKIPKLNDKKKPGFIRYILEYFK